ncbi:acyl-CoA dehydrogenase family protein [Aliikangiella maris]|uniref:Acyl-CoA dehydrogenase family protein n=2 Tax=Aliikangiella maris TaxID=3162458 RepID=A0ABV3MI41_9GAMM
MPQYQAPLNDFEFILHDWLKLTDHYQAIGAQDAADQSLVNAILNEAAKFSETLLSPINYSGDQQSSQLNNGLVTTPSGFKDAYQQYCDAGWSSLACNPEFGGQGLPFSLSAAVAEMVAGANASWSMFPGLTHGAISALENHANESLQAQYLPQLISGQWSGTMCLTEAHCGSDLGLLKTRATPSKDGEYVINGSKIFISAGEHDLAENIIHFVLARVDGAPEGTAGISLFLVPKMLTVISGKSVQSDNQVECSSIEHKMGIKASPTCVLNFDNSRGYLIGELNQGLSCMFTMMNKARLATGIQGYAIAELAKQASLTYASERLQMRAISGAKMPQKPADPIIVHADIKRMLFTQKAIVEGCRGLAMYVATLVDKIELSQQPSSDIESRLGLLTPICKAFMSETGFEACNLAIQIYGGHGYIQESEIEQLVRDVRITSIYEGTNGIQALDLLGRKVLKDKFHSVNQWLTEIKIATENSDEKFVNYAHQLLDYCSQWQTINQNLAQKVSQNPDEISAAAFDYLMFCGYVSVAHIFLQQANSLQHSSQSESFKQDKLQLLNFYFLRLLPRATYHQTVINAGAESLNCEAFQLK